MPGISRKKSTVAHQKGRNKDQLETGNYTYFPLLDVPISQRRFIDAQFWHGCISRTLQRTRRVLQEIQALFARFLIGKFEAFGGILER